MATNKDRAGRFSDGEMYVIDNGKRVKASDFVKKASAKDAKAKAKPAKKK